MRDHPYLKTSFPETTLFLCKETSDQRPPHFFLKPFQSYSHVKEPLSRDTHLADNCLTPWILVRGGFH